MKRRKVDIEKSMHYLIVKVESGQKKKKKNLNEILANPDDDSISSGSESDGHSPQNGHHTHNHQHNAGNHNDDEFDVIVDDKPKKPTKDPFGREQEGILYKKIN